MESYTIKRYENEDLDYAPDGVYVAHVNHEIPEVAKIAKVTTQIVLIRLGGLWSEPNSSYRYRGFIYAADGPVERVTLTD